MPKKICRVQIAVWILSFIAVVTAQRQPPMITKFSQKDLIDPDEVKFREPNGFSLPCEASGSNLTWTWNHNGEPIKAFYGYPFSLSQDGTLTGHYLRAQHSGTYQCFVKDEVTGVEVFSRKLKVNVTVVGDFIDTRDVVKKVDLGQPFIFQCPEHKASFGVVYTWVGRENIQFSRNKRRGISADGGLYIAYLTQKDIDEIRENKGIRCKISAVNKYQESGTLKLEKNNEEPSDAGNPLSWAIKPAAEEIAIEGRRKTFYCFAKGRPAPSITWKKNGQRIVDGQNLFEVPASFHGRRLIIKSVSRAMHQDNKYTCEAVSNGRTLIHTIKLVVEVAPRWTVKPPLQKMNIVIGTNGALECNVTAIPPGRVTWYKNGVQLESSDEHLKMYEDKLEFKDIDQESDGVYQCTAENRHGMIVSATWVHVLAWKPTFTDVQFGPFHLLHGSQGRLECKPSAAPRPTFQWFRNGVLISYEDKSRYELEREGTLVIKNVDRELDAVNFTCRAENNLGADSASRVAVVFVPPSFTTEPADKTVMENERVTFLCTASGNPTPNITWVKDGSTLSTGNTLRFMADRDLSGKYWCVADNGLGITIRAEADLDVQFAPSFTTKPRDQTVTEYETVTFNCAATGNPTPQTTWIKDGITVGTANNLTFTASRNDSGKYWCFVKNGLGAVEESADLDVQYKPENTQLVANAANTNLVPFGSKVTFTCTSDSHPVVHEYKFYRFQELLGYSKTGIFHLNVNKTGLYSCIPFNVVGSGVRAAVTIVVDGVPSPPSNLQITNLDCNEWTLKLSWVPGAANGAPIDYFLIEEGSTGNPVKFAFLYNVTDPKTTQTSLTLSRKSLPRLRMKAVNMFGASRPSVSTADGTCMTPATATVLQRAKTLPVYSRAWFLTVVVLVAYGFLFVVAAILIKKYRQGRGHKYNVKLREKKYGVSKNQEKQKIQDREQQNDEDEGHEPFLENNNPRKGPPDLNGRPMSYYSLFEENLFSEDVSFADEYKDTDVVFTYEKEGTYV